MTWVEWYQTNGATVAYAIGFWMAAKWAAHLVFGRGPLIARRYFGFSAFALAIVFSAAASTALTVLVGLWWESRALASVQFRPNGSAERSINCESGRGGAGAALGANFITLAVCHLTVVQPPGRCLMKATNRDGWAVRIPRELAIVYPVADSRIHDLTYELVEGELTLHCWCKPGYENGAIIHHSNDGREAWEVTTSLGGKAEA